MARKVFFSFHFQRDAWRVSQVRNSNIISSNYDKNQFLDAADWEKVERSGDASIKKWIDSQLVNTSVTIVLIGTQTSTRKWVDYEIEQSVKKGNGMIGIYIHNLRNQYGETDFKGKNPFEKYNFTSIKTYDWINDDGRIMIGQWIENAAKSVGR